MNKNDLHASVIALCSLILQLYEKIKVPIIYTYDYFLVYMGIT